MSTIKVHKNFGLNLNDLQFAELDDPNASYQRTPTSFIITYGPGERDEFRGANFTYNAQGIPTGGVVSSYKHVVGNTAIVQVSDAAVPVSLIIAAVLDPSPAKALVVLNALLGGKDTFIGGNLRDFFAGFNGNDVLKGGGGNDQLSGMNGDDKIFGQAGDDVLRGDAGNDRLLGGAGNDQISGGDGNDVIKGQGGNDVLDGGAGNDRIDGGAGNDRATGGAGNDVINGQGGNDVLDGGAGNDKLNGGGGADKLTGGAGKDVLTGGGGADVFIYKSVSDSTVAASGRDKIVGFKPNEDRIDLSAIDANTSTSANDSFTFIGGSSFSGSAGELRAVKSSSGTYVSGDVNGDGTADFMIFLAKNGGHNLDSGDFIL